MAPPVIITFLGTSSAVPSQTRNHSALCLTLPSGNTYLFDAGEATQHQLQKVSGGFKRSSLRKIFITHMHGDHMFGVVPLLCTLLNGAGGTVGVEDPRDVAATEVLEGGGEDRKAEFELYGPEGLREYIRMSLRLTRSLLGATYVVHELHFSNDGLDGRVEKDASQDRMPMELQGYNFFPEKDGYWRDILSSTGSSNREWDVSAGPILHSVPCLGYILTEPPLPGKVTPDYKDKIMANKEALIKSGVKNPMSLLSKVTALSEGEVIELPDGNKLTRPEERRGRKIAILGDTYDPSPIAGLAHGSDVLIHEATNAFLGDILGKESGEYKEGETYEDVKKKTIEHGHSTPEMAAEFALDIKLAKNGGVFGTILEDKKQKKGKVKTTSVSKGVLLLNHFSSRYADPRLVSQTEQDSTDPRSSETAGTIMEAIRSCAVRAMENGKQTLENESQRQEIDVICAYDLMQYEVRAGD
ncbi:hypothetical protein TWF694_005517 [Orbilia ellipsospora]|uniref:Metallo-beta-lactamase domain-containing protein n=1 Tax=Orbilia ellipsospora TaxID=2528407 RepID=A0AAV9WTK2_9PEZI